MTNQLVKLKDWHIWDRVVFLGAGTSLLDFDLEALNNNAQLHTFSFNNFIPFYRSFWPKLELDFAMIHDSKVLQVPFHQYHQKRDADGHSSYGLSLDDENEFKNVSPANFIIKEKLYDWFTQGGQETKIITCANLVQQRIHDSYGVQTNQEWYEANPEFNKHLYNWKYNIADKVTDYRHPEVIDGYLNLALWAKNSFCNSALPILFWLGFREIYLAGVDYSDDGYFFCPTDKNKQKVSSIYVEKEYSQFNQMMQEAEKLGISIYTIDSKKTKIIAKDGRIPFKDIL